MRNKTKVFKNKILEEKINDYSGLGYFVIGTEKKGENKTLVHFGQPPHLPQMQRLKALERRYNWLTYRRHYHGYIPLVLGAAVIIVFTILRIIPWSFGKILEENLKWGEIGFQIGYNSHYILGGLFLLFAFLEIFWMLARRARYPYEKREVVNEGLEIQLKLRTLPKDEFVRKDGTHYHKIYDYYRSREKMREG